MNWEKIAQYDDGKGLTLIETLQRIKPGDRIPSSKEHSDRLVHSDLWESEKEMYPCRTGTLAIYRKPDVPFGETLEWEGLQVIIPKEFQGKSNIVLLCNHPDFKLEGNTLTLGKSVKFLPMPRESGEWHDPDAEFEFPTGEKKGYSDSRRRLWRRDSDYIGLVARNYYWNGDGRRDVGCSYLPSYRLGVFSVKGKPGKHKHIWKTTCTGCGVMKK